MSRNTIIAVPAKAKLTDAQVRKLRRRLGAGARLSELAAEYKVNRKTIRRRLDALECAEAERTVADRAEEKWMKRLRGRADRKPERAPEQRPGERRDRSQASRPRLHQASSARLRSAGVPRFPNTPEGRAERLAYYDARKLNRLPDSLLDYHDVLRGRETPAERRAREARASGRR
jgi:hypothetical protein